MKKHLQSGMSFIEITIVILIMGILAAVVAPAALRWVGKGKVTATKTGLQVIASEIENYQMDVGSYPTTLADLTKKPQDVTGWDGPYIKGQNTLKDGWNNEFIYKVNSRGTQPPYELYSLGDPKQEDGRIHAE